jgi:hypothetical protein
MKVTLFYTQNRSESGTFLHHFMMIVYLFLLPIAYLFFFHYPFRPDFSSFFDMQKNSVFC